jgi:hypothetical protein
VAIPASADVQDIDIAKVLGRTRESKIEKWREDPTDCDLHGMIQAWSDGVPVMFAFANKSREQKHMAIVLLGGVAKDLLVMVNDSYHAKQMTKTDGSDWQPGDMQYAWEHNTPDKKLLGEGLLCAVFDRKGNVSAAQQSYVATPESLDFEEPDIQLDVGSRMGGSMFTMGRQAMTSPNLWDEMRVQGIDHALFGLTPEAARTHALCAVAKMLMVAGVPCAIGCMSEESEEIIRTSLVGFKVERL